MTAPISKSPIVLGPLRDWSYKVRAASPEAPPVLEVRDAPHRIEQSGEIQLVRGRNLVQEEADWQRALASVVEDDGTSIEEIDLQFESFSFDGDLP